MTKSKKQSDKTELSLEQSEDLLDTLKKRFAKNMNRHKGLDWEKVATKLEAKPR